jgi:PAS domain S-box-containing protein
MEDQVEEIRERLEKLYQALNDSEQPLDENYTEAFHEIGLVLEELRSTEEALQQSYDELMHTREQMENERRHFQELFEFAPDAYLITNPLGRIQQANTAAGTLFHLQTNLLVGKPLPVFIEPDSRSLFYPLLDVTTKVEGIELGLLPRKTPRIDVSVTVAAVNDALGDRVGLRWQLHDITEQKKARGALEASEERLNTIFHETNIGMCLTDLEGQIVDGNPAFLGVIGYSIEEMRGTPISGLVPVQDRLFFGSRLQQLAHASGGLVTSESRMMTAQDNEVWVRISVSLLRDRESNPQYFLFMIENITQMREAASELVEMKRRLLESTEAERQRLAQELHDGPMQDLYGAVFKLSDAKLFARDEAVKDNIKDAEDMIKNVAGRLREICGDLRPPVLANLGLGRAIRSHIDTRMGVMKQEIEVELHLEIDEKSLPQEARLHLFRVYQQCLSNILRHAEATRISISLEIEDHQALLLIEDNGKGFSPPRKWIDMIRQGHYGLADAAERIETINGSFQIFSGPGRGTRVEAHVPL